MSKQVDQQDLGLAGWLAFQLYRVVLAEGLERRGFTDLREGDWNLVRYLHHAGTTTVTEWARLNGVTKQAASQQVASLVERGYAARAAAGDGDGRVRAIELTARGRAARDAAVAVADEVEAELVHRLGAAAVADWRAVGEVLVADHLERAPEFVRVAAAMSSRP